MKRQNVAEVKKIGFRDRIRISDFGLAEHKVFGQDVVVSSHRQELLLRAIYLNSTNLKTTNKCFIHRPTTDIGIE
jgi:hypothetical protein